MGRDWKKEDDASTKATAERIREARKLLGLTQEELAIEIGVAQSTVAQWELGTRSTSWGMMRKIAESLDVSVSWLRGNPGSYGPPISGWERRNDNPGKLFCGVCHRNSTITRSEVIRISGKPYPYFCPWCGARLRGEKEDKE